MSTILGSVNKMPFGEFCNAISLFFIYHLSIARLPPPPPKKPKQNSHFYFRLIKTSKLNNKYLPCNTEPANTGVTEPRPI